MLGFILRCCPFNLTKRVTTFIFKNDAALTLSIVSLRFPRVSLISLGFAVVCYSFAVNHCGLSLPEPLLCNLVSSKYLPQLLHVILVQVNGIHYFNYYKGVNSSKISQPLQSTCIHYVTTPTI
jgi:hypothetical protein